MNPILEQIYSTILPAAPYVIAAYALIWLALFVYVFIIMRGVKKAGAKTTTSAVRGAFERSQATRAEALSLIFARRD